ncbi:MAG: RdgB/HAM1 family non-canonical purine NTP pyrophosphatase [Bryobacteraceae bacterium]
MILYCATTNPGKLKEFRLAAEKFGRGALEIRPLDAESAIPVVEETGETYEANAILKAIHYSEHAPGLLFADDSGLEVLALGGKPGVRSARFAGPEATDDTNNRLLLERLRIAEDRAARFVCAIAVAQRGQIIRTFQGTIDGRILEAPRGTGGFGYDPLFYCPPFGCSFGEIGPDRKLLVSHRGQALKQMMAWAAGEAESHR